MKKIMRLVLLLLTTCLIESSVYALSVTNAEPPHILIEAVVLTAASNRHASLAWDGGHRSVVSSNLFLPEAVSWFTNLVSVIGLQDGVQYLAKFKDPLSLTVAALADEYSVVILVRPRILTSEAHAAQFYIGDPYPNISSQGYLGFPGLELNLTPRLESNGLIALNFRYQSDTPIGTTNVLDQGREEISKSTTNDVSMVVRDGETFMALCALNPTPKRVSTFRKSIHALSALFGRPLPQPRKREMVVLFRAKHVTNLSWDQSGAPVFPEE